ncbi:hypothetical protein LSAT2_028122 [Lamellibrachia satsuma]|nr:hypothetical protein LSAT2_028122 [Lamellibrachia satsuma]
MTGIGANFTRTTEIKRNDRYRCQLHPDYRDKERRQVSVSTSPGLQKQKEMTEFRHLCYGSTDFVNMAGQCLILVVLSLLCMAFSFEISRTANQLLGCTGQLTHVNFARINFKTTASMKCRCSITSKQAPWMAFIFEAQVYPRGTVSNVCVTPVDETNRLAPLKKTECINRITHWSRDPTFCGWHACLQVFFEVDGSSFVRVKPTHEDTFSIVCDTGESLTTEGTITTTKSGEDLSTTPIPEAKSTTSSTSSTTTTTTTTTPTTTTETATPIAQPATSTDAPTTT